MNGKLKAAMIALVALGLVASVFYVVPTLAYMNGATDQTQGRNGDRLRDRDCVHDCTCDCEGAQDRNQTRARLQLQECTQVGTGMNSSMLQHQYQYRYRNTLSP